MKSLHFQSKSDTEKVLFFESLFRIYPDIVFVYDVLKHEFSVKTPNIEINLGIKNFDYNNNSCDVSKSLLHPEDWVKVTQLIQKIKQLDYNEHITAELRFRNDNNVYKYFSTRLCVFSKQEETGLVTQILGVSQDSTDKKQIETQRSKDKTKLDELAFIASHELGHEYAKIQSIIQLIDNKYITDTERTDLINEAKKSIQIINSSIFKLNHKLSFNQTDDFFATENEVKKYNKILLIDDDVLTNVLNKKIINTVVPDKPMHIFLNIDDALQYLKVKDTDGDYMIFLDINFPDRNGWDFLNEYKNFAVQSKVVVLSSSIDNRDREKSRSYELVIDYITKPLSVEFIKNLFEQ